MNKRYVLDAAGVEAVNRVISRVDNTPPAMLDTGRRHRITVTESGGDSGYNGYFKVIDASEGDAFKVKVIDGKDPAGAICGLTDIGEVPAGIVENPAGKYVALTARYNEERNAYEFELVAGTYNELRQHAYFVLAEVDANRAITQLWQDGVINFGERYVI